MPFWYHMQWLRSYLERCNVKTFITQNWTGLKQLEDWIQLRYISYAPFVVYFPVHLHSNLASKPDSSSVLKEHDY